MEIGSKQQSRAIAEKNGWSIYYAEGYLQGQYSRRNSARLSSYAMAGFDDYCLGFRAGYFGRRKLAAMLDERVPSASQPERPNSHPSTEPGADAGYAAHPARIRTDGMAASGSSLNRTQT